MDEVQAQIIGASPTLHDVYTAFSACVRTYVPGKAWLGTSVCVCERNYNT